MHGKLVKNDQRHKHQGRLEVALSTYTSSKG